MVNIYKNDNLKKLTIEDKIVLLLLELNFFQSKQIVPEIMTEYGIQKVFGCSLGLLSQILTKLEYKTYVFHKLLKIEHKKRKQYVFFLTKEGLEYALELKKSVGEFKHKILGTNYTQRKLFEYNQMVKSH